MTERTPFAFFLEIDRTSDNRNFSSEEVNTLVEDRSLLNEQYNLKIKDLPATPTAKDLFSIENTLSFVQMIISSIEVLEAHKKNPDSIGKGPNRTLVFYETFLVFLEQYMDFLEKVPNLDTLIDIEACNTLLKSFTAKWEESTYNRKSAYSIHLPSLPLLEPGSNAEIHQTLKNLTQSIPIVFAELYYEVQVFKKRIDTRYRQSIYLDSILKTDGNTQYSRPKIKQKYRRTIDASDRNTLETEIDNTLERICTSTELPKPDAHLDIMRTFKKQMKAVLKLTYDKIEELAIRLYNDLYKAENPADNQRLQTVVDALILDLNGKLSIKSRDQSLKFDDKSSLTKDLEKLYTFSEWKLKQLKQPNKKHDRSRNEEEIESTPKKIQLS